MIVRPVSAVARNALPVSRVTVREINTLQRPPLAHRPTNIAF